VGYSVELNPGSEGGGGGLGGDDHGEQPVREPAHWRGFGGCDGVGAGGDEEVGSGGQGHALQGPAQQMLIQIQTVGIISQATSMGIAIVVFLRPFDI